MICRNSGSRVVDAEKEGDPGACADAAHADDLARQVDEPELLEQVAAVGLQRPPVGTNESAHFLLELVPLDLGREELVDRDDQRRVADDARLALDEVGQLLERMHAVLGAGSLDAGFSLLQPLRVDAGAELRDCLLDRQVRVPKFEVPHLREAAHRLPVSANGVEHNRAPLLR